MGIKDDGDGDTGELFVVTEKNRCNDACAGGFLVDPRVRSSSFISATSKISLPCEHGRST